MINLSEWALKHRSLVAYIMIVAVIAGVLSYFRLGRSEDPTFIIKTMVVQAAWPGATIEETLKQVTERLERKLQETPHLDFLRSFTRAGVTTIFVNLKGSASAKRSRTPGIRFARMSAISATRFRQELSGPASMTISVIRSGSSTALRATVSRIANCAIVSRISARSCSWCLTYQKSNCWGRRTKGSSSNSR